MVKVNYNQENGSIIGFYPEPYSDYSVIPEPNIEIDQETWIDCINNPGLRKVDLETLQIIVYTPPGPTEQEIKNQALDILNADYSQRLKILESCFTKPDILFKGTPFESNITIVQSQIRPQYQSTHDEMIIKQGVILNG